MSFVNYLAGLWSIVTSVFNSTCSFLQDLVNRINGATSFDSSNPVMIFFGTIHYLLGDTFYTLFVSMIYISACFMLYNLINKLVELTAEWIKKNFTNRVI